MAKMKRFYISMQKHFFWKSTLSSFDYFYLSKIYSYFHNVTILRLLQGKTIYGAQNLYKAFDRAATYSRSQTAFQCLSLAM